jgi:6,7-dimethyl-8-ribityllumazine synthase
MIKGITFVHAASTPAVYDTLHRFCSAVGLEPGRSWETDMSRGAPFLAPVGSFELLDGMAHLPAELLIEVTAIDDVHRAAKEWLEQAVGPQEAAKRITNVGPTTWKSLAFTVALPLASGNGRTRCAASRLPLKVISRLRACDLGWLCRGGMQ